MQSNPKNIAYSFLVILALSCSGDKKKDTPPAMVSVKKNSSLNIELIGTLCFRKSYAGRQFLKTDKEIDKYEREVDKSNPGLDEISADKNVKKRFTQLGFLRNDGLLLNKFKYDTATKCKLQNESGKTINVSFKRVLTTDTYLKPDYRISASSGPDTTSIDIDGLMMELKYALIDIIPGGYKEIVVLCEYYIIMGYNFDFYVYELKDQH